jgi:hypothetical protein
MRIRSKITLYNKKELEKNRKFRMIKNIDMMGISQLIHIFSPGKQCIY